MKQITVYGFIDENTGEIIYRQDALAMAELGWKKAYTSNGIRLTQEIYIEEDYVPFEKRTVISRKDIDELINSALYKGFPVCELHLTEEQFNTFVAFNIENKDLKTWCGIVMTAAGPIQLIKTKTTRLFDKRGNLIDLTKFHPKGCTFAGYGNSL